MTASLAFRMRYAELIVLSALYGRTVADAVLSRPARKPVASCSKKPAAGIPIPQGRLARAA